MIRCDLIQVLLPMGHGDGALVVEKFYDRKPLLYPERRLLFALLWDAVQSLQERPHGQWPIIKKETEYWIMRPDDWGICSFINCCEALGLDPEFVRKGLSEKYNLKLSKKEPPPIVQPIIGRPRTVKVRQYEARNDRKAHPGRNRKAG